MDGMGMIKTWWLEDDSGFLLAIVFSDCLLRLGRFPPRKFGWYSATCNLGEFFFLNNIGKTTSLKVGDWWYISNFPVEFLYQSVTLLVLLTSGLGSIFLLFSFLSLFLLAWKMSREDIYLQNAWNPTWSPKKNHSIWVGPTREHISWWGRFASQKYPKMCALVFQSYRLWV